MTHASMPNAAAPRGSRSFWRRACVGPRARGDRALWAHYGTAVFFEIIRAGFAACFG